MAGESPTLMSMLIFLLCGVSACTMTEIQDIFATFTIEKPSFSGNIVFFYLTSASFFILSIFELLFRRIKKYMTQRGWFDLIAIQRLSRSSPSQMLFKTGDLTKGLNDCNFNKKRLQQTCFPLNIANF